MILRLQMRFFKKMGTKLLTLGFSFLTIASCLAQAEFKMTANDGTKDNLFGISVAVSGNYTIVGASGDNDLGDRSGSAYIFERNGGNWSQAAKLLASDGAKDDRFGISVAISGNYAIVGATDDDDDDDLGNKSGSAYIFELNGANWFQVTKLTANNGAKDDLFGSSVSISGEYAIVGAPGDDDLGGKSGSAYIFRRNGATWIQSGKLVASDGAKEDRFGISVAINSEYAIIGADGDDLTNVPNAGSAYIFKRNGFNWLQTKKLTVNNPAKKDRFGIAVAISDTFAIVGANGDDKASGSAYIFTNTGSNWIQIKELIANDRSIGDGFGNSVSLKGDYAIIGASGDNDLGDNSGSTYIFKRSMSDWTQVRKLTASDGTNQDLFGLSVAIGEDYAIVGASRDDDLGNQSGSTYIYNFAVLSIAPLSLDFADSLNTQMFTLTNSGFGGNVGWLISTDQSWISASSVSGRLAIGSQSVAVTIDRTGLPAGNYTGTVTIDSNVGKKIVQIRMTVKGALAISTDLATNVNVTTATLNGSVNPNGVIADIIFEYGLTTNYGQTIAATSSPVTGRNPVSVSTEIAGLSPGTAYHYRIVATSSAGTTTGADRTFTTYQATFKISTTLNFPDRSSAFDYNATEYRIFGLPGASNQLVTDFLSGVQNEDWQVFWDNGESSDYLVEYDGSENFRFAVGRAFWIINRGPLSINTTVASEPLDADGEVEIPLQPGFNLITNPFPTPINWRNVQNLNGNVGPIFAYDSSFVQSQSFDPFIGYYFFNDSLTSLKIPYSLTFSPSLELTSVDKHIWRINISLSSRKFSSQSILAGTASNARPGIDRFDYRKPRHIAPVPSVYFHHPEWDNDYTTFATDIRPEINKSETWEFQVFSPLREPLYLSFSHIESIPWLFDVYLIDDTKGDFVNLHLDSRYRFTPTNEVSTFRLVIGESDALEETLDSIRPAEFVLGNNYPNPFNPSTTFFIFLPIASEIKVKIYNILAEEVKTIYTGHAQVGRHTFSWSGIDDSGKEVASGVYLYSLTANTKISLTGKMILLK